MTVLNRIAAFIVLSVIALMAQPANSAFDPTYKLAHWTLSDGTHYFGDATAEIMVTDPFCIQGFATFIVGFSADEIMLLELSHKPAERSLFDATGYVADGSRISFSSTPGESSGIVDLGVTASNSFAIQVETAKGVGDSSELFALGWARRQ